VCWYAQLCSQGLSERTRTLLSHFSLFQCGLFHVIHNARTIWLRMVGWFMNWKIFGRKRPWHNWGAIPQLSWRD
jgi:hypothetical protein